MDADTPSIVESRLGDASPRYSIPLYRPALAGNEKLYVTQCLDSTWISSKGEFVTRFEQAFAASTGNRHATSVCNGTAALHLALIALGIGPGDEVIVPTLTYVASVNAITYVGATPVFVDSLPDTWQMNPEDIRRRITPRTRAIMVVHLYGHPCDMGSIMAIARAHDCRVIEDCAEAFGARYQGAHVGTCGDIATYSFFGNKTITTGEGGMVVTDDDTLHERAVHFKGQGLAKQRQYWHDVVGYNYRMTNICAAIGLAQLERAEQLLVAKKRLAHWYAAGLRDVAVTLQAEASDVQHAHWMCSFLVADPAHRESLRAALAARGVETRPLFSPVHTMPMYAAGAERHPVAENLAGRGISVPSWPGLARVDVESICGIIRAFVDPPRSPVA
jgi:perosamine synthetase